jgi:Tol biopolymer transport system component
MVYVGETQNEDRNLVHSVDVMNSDGTDVQTIVPIKDRVVYERPLWSTDGRYIVYSVGIPQSNGPTFWNIYVYDIQDGQSFMITEGDTTSHRYFSWIPNTHQIVFDERMPQTGTSGFMKVDIADPDAISPYFDLDKEEIQPSVSPDGKFLAYMQRDGRTGNIYVVDLSTKVVTQLTKGEFQDLYPVWSPDVRTIFFDSAETAFITVWSVNIDGTNLTQLTFGKDRFPFVDHMYALIPK